VQYYLKITNTNDDSITYKSIINSTYFDFGPNEGMQPGVKYTVTLQAYNFYTTFFDVN